MMNRSHLRTLLALLAAVLTFTSWAAAQGSKMLSLMPFPANVRPGEGYFAIDKSFTIELHGHMDARVKRAADRFLGNLSRRTGVLFGAGPMTNAHFMISCASEVEKIQNLAEEEDDRLE